MAENLLQVHWWYWVAFGALVVVLLAVDLLVFHRRIHTPTLRESAAWSAFWITLALVFNAVVWWWGEITHGDSKAGMDFLAAYLVEKSLSMDNLFVFAVIFRFFQVPLKYQYRVLFWGILGAVLLRLAFILGGVELIRDFEVTLAVFGAFLLYTGVKLALSHDTEVHPDKNFVLRTARRFFHVTREDHGEHFFAREAGRLCITPLFLVLLVIESTDVLFAVDSVPAVLGITHDAFIAFTSNVFAILGLRALYFLLAGVIDRFRYLHYGLSAVLVFIGAKMIGEYAFKRWTGEEELRAVPSWVSLLVIASLLAVSILASVAAKRREERISQSNAAALAPDNHESAISDQRSLAAGQQSAINDQQSLAGGQQSAISDQQSSAAGQQSAISNQQSFSESPEVTISAKHCVVTGGAGFIGSHLVEALLARGDRVSVIDDESTGSPANLSAVRDNPRLTYYKGSVADRELVRRVVADADEVFHLAAAVGVALIAKAPIHTLETNIYLTELLLSELAPNGRPRRPVKLYLASSSEVYGKNPIPRWDEEEDLVFGPTTRPRWSYGMSKAIDEFLALAYCHERGLPVVIGRFFNVVGPRQTGAYGMVLPRFVDAALAGGPLVVHDDGRQVRCFGHVSDVVGAVLALMETPEAVGRVFNIGSDQPIAIVDLARRVIAAVDPGLKIVFQSYAEAYSENFEDCRSRVPDLTRLRQTIAYQPRYTLDEIIREVIAWKREKKG